MKPLWIYVSTRLHRWCLDRTNFRVVFLFVAFRLQRYTVTFRWSKKINQIINPANKNVFRYERGKVQTLAIRWEKAEKSANKQLFSSPNPIDFDFNGYVLILSSFWTYSNVKGENVSNLKKVRTKNNVPSFFKHKTSFLYFWSHSKTSLNPEVSIQNQNQCGLEEKSHLLADFFFTISKRVAEFAPCLVNKSKIKTKNIMHGHLSLDISVVIRLTFNLVEKDENLIFSCHVSCYDDWWESAKKNHRKTTEFTVSCDCNWTPLPETIAFLSCLFWCLTVCKFIVLNHWFTAAYIHSVSVMCKMVEERGWDYGREWQWGWRMLGSIQSVCWRTFKDGLFQFAHRLPPKRQHSRHHEIQHNTQRPDVHRPAFVALVSEELGRGVRRWPTERGQGLTLQADGAEPKVSHLFTAQTQHTWSINHRGVFGSFFFLSPPWSYLARRKRRSPPWDRDVLCSWCAVKKIGIWHDFFF